METSKKCQGGQCISTRKKRPLIYNGIPTFDGSDFGTGKPKSKETMDKLKRHVLGDNTTAEEPPPLKTTRMDTSLYSNNESKVKSQIVNSVLSQKPMVKDFLSRQQKDKSTNQQIEMKNNMIDRYNQLKMIIYLQQYLRIA